MCDFESVIDTVDPKRFAILGISQGATLRVAAVENEFGDPLG